MSLKKFELNRETLRTLDTQEQDQIQGGASLRCGYRCSSDSASIVTTRRIYCC